MGSRPLACMTGDFSLLRALGRAGIPAAVATSEVHSPMRRSRYCKEIVRIPGWVERAEQSLEAILSWSRGQAEPPVFFYQGDHDLLAVSRGRHTLDGAIRCVLPPADLVEDLGDKLRFADLAERQALPVPPTVVLRRGSPVDEALRRWNRFPCVLKPSTRSPRFVQVAREQKALRAESRAELDGLRDVVAGYDSDFLLQEAIEGGEECIESYHAYLRPGGQVVGEFTGRKLRTTPRRYGFSTYVEITEREDVRTQGRSILEKIGFNGVVKIDFKRDPSSGRLHLLELNPRFNLWHHPGAVAGVSLPALVYQDCLEPGSAKPAGPARAGVRWMTAREDWGALREYREAGELSTARWLVQFLSVTVNEGFMFRDPMPGLAGLGSTIRRKAARLLGLRPAPPVAESP